ncbi:MAG: hypothetical protein GY847_14220 [Proteobacteria bacterium]|nr:hypothetical protein [Pseudomonadota bacterium]
MATPLLARRKNIGIEQEATAGTAETIVAADVFAALEPSIVQTVEEIDNSAYADSASTVPSRPGSKTGTVTLGFELQGGGTAGTAPLVHQDLYEGCGFSETADAGYDVRYTLANTGDYETFTSKLFQDGIYKTLRGCVGNMVITGEAGAIVTAQVDGQGVYSARGDTAILTATGDMTTEPPLLTSAEMIVGEQHDIWQQDLDGTAEELNQATGTVHAEVAVGPVTQGAVAQHCHGIWVNLIKQGVPENETFGFRIEIETNNAGDPSGTAITNGVSDSIATTAISDATAKWYFFPFGTNTTRPELEAATVYHFVLKSDYDASDTKNIKFDIDVVGAGDQNSQTNTGGSWGAIALKNVSMKVLVTDRDEIMWPGFTLDLGNSMEERPDVNSAEGKLLSTIVSRTPVINVEPEERLAADFDIWNLRVNNTTVHMVIDAIGTTAGEIIQIWCEGFKVTDVPETGERAGVVTQPFTMQQDPTLTGSQITIIYK